MHLLGLEQLIHYDIIDKYDAHSQRSKDTQHSFTFTDQNTNSIVLEINSETVLIQKSDY